MKGETILIADDDEMVRRSLARSIKQYGEKDDQRVVGEASSKNQVESLLVSGLTPSVAFVDGHFPRKGDGELAAKIIRRLSPKTFIISLSSDLQKWGDRNWNKNMSESDIVKYLTELQH